jgi:hypothetical protein
VPGVWKVKEKLRPDPTIPEFHPGTSDVDVCEVESVFVHVTAVPTATLKSPGTKALLPRNSARVGIVTDTDCAPGDGVGDGTDGEVGVGRGAEGGGDDELPPQARTSIKAAETAARRSDNMLFSSG